MHGQVRSVLQVKKDDIEGTEGHFGQLHGEKNTADDSLSQSHAKLFEEEDQIETAVQEQAAQMLRLVQLQNGSGPISPPLGTWHL